MINERALRLALFIGVAALHGILIFFLAFNINAVSQGAPEMARVMKVTDITEEIPPPPPEDEPPVPEVEAIAENMIETDVVPEQNIVSAGSITRTSDDYLPVHLVSERPYFDVKEITSATIYPPIAQRSGIEGRVMLELFVDRNGLVQRITVLQENPPGRGFAEAAVKAFQGRRGLPARANGEAVSCHFRWPVNFILK
jgi:protein TonB